MIDSGEFLRSAAALQRHRQRSNDPPLANAA
jgi:hypothetical protein